ncbi:hypothetical protein ACX52_4377 [Yersinia pestis]|nr:hypothetical protein ACX52_4377 [Yersinia pestis]
MHRSLHRGRGTHSLMRQYYLALRCHILFLVLHAVKQGFIFGDAKVRTRHINHRFSPYHTPSQNTSCEGLFYVVAKKKPLCLKEGLYVSKKYRVLSTFGSFRLITKWNTGNALKLRNVLINYFFNFVLSKKKIKSGLFVLLLIILCGGLISFLKSTWSYSYFNLDAIHWV